MTACGVRREERFRAARYVEFTWGRDHGWTVGVYRGALQSLAAAEVITISTTLRARTANGVGFRSTDRTLKRALRARCYRPNWILGGPEEHAGIALKLACFVGPRGTAPTLFMLINQCRVATGKYVLCRPKRQRRYVVYEVLLESRLAQRIFRSSERTTPWMPVP